MPVIPTPYSGIRFRSRLEARRAVHASHLKMRWIYEPEAYELADGSGYTPDFFFPKFDGCGVYGEVKPDGDAFVKARRFCLETGNRIWLMEGEARCVTEALLQRVSCPDCSDHPGQPCRPPEVEVLEVVPLLDQAQDEYRFYYTPGPPLGCDFLPWYRDEAQHLIAACEAARTHRFWDPAPGVSP